MRAILTYLTPSVVLSTLLAFGIFLTFSAFYIEHVLGAAPCTMCWWQRYTHWVIWIISLLGIFLHNRLPLVWFIYVNLVVIIVSAGIGYYQGLGQLGLVTLPAVCGNGKGVLSSPDQLLAALISDTAAIPSCAETGFVVFGLSLAWWNAIVMTVATIVLMLWIIFNKKVKYSK